MNIKKTTLTLATIMTGLNAGLFFAFHIAIIPAFKTLSDHTYITSMQAINSAILNPVFLSNFIGPAIVWPIATYLHRGEPTRFKLLLAASLLFIIGTFGVTSAANVPLNDMLAQFSLQSSTPQQITAMRTAFEGPWNNWNVIRTTASIFCLLLSILACISSLSAHSSASRQKSA